MKTRLRAAAVHLLASMLVAALAAFLVFCLWYPGDFPTIAGGAKLFLLVMSVDVISGPALTFVIASHGKPRPEFLRDLTVIALLQLSALGYGIYTMAAARPVAVVFEVDLFRVVTAIEVDQASLPEAPANLRQLSWSGPRIIAAPKPTNADEQLRTIELGLNQVQLAMLPRYWRDYASNDRSAVAKGRPLAQLVGHYPQAAEDVRHLASTCGRSIDELRFLPLVSRQVSWTAVVSAVDASIVGYLPYDAFF